jgi:hypothetical protein
VSERRIVERPVVLRERLGDEEARRVYQEDCIRVPAGELLPDSLDLGAVGEEYYGDPSSTPR